MPELTGRSMLQIALVGCGQVVEQWHLAGLAAHRSTCRVTAVVDPSSHRRTALVDALDAEVTGYPDVLSLLASGQHFDLTVVATPTAEHSAAIGALVAAGIPTLVEKPLAVTAQEAERAVPAGARNLVGVVHSYLYHRTVMAMLDAVRSMELGTVEVVRIRLALVAAPRGVGANPDWRLRSEGGGSLRDLGYHLLYLSEALHGAAAVGVSARRQGRTAAADDAAWMLLDHPDGVSVLEVGWHRTTPGLWIDVECEQGELALQPGRQPLMRRRGHAAERHLDLSADDRGPYGRLYADTIAQLAGGGPPGVDWDRAVKTLEVLDACQVAASSGRRVALRPRGVPV